MKISTDKRILAAAQECSDEYHQELQELEGVDHFESVADWKEIAFFIKGADWMRVNGLWNKVSDKDITLPSYKNNTPILVSDGETVSVIGVKAFIENVDKPYNQWKYWMAIPLTPNKFN